MKLFSGLALLCFQRNTYANVNMRFTVSLVAITLLAIVSATPVPEPASSGVSKPLIKHTKQKMPPHVPGTRGAKYVHSK
jgi:hypothetical protein